MTPINLDLLKSTKLLLVFSISVLGFCSSCKKDETKGYFVITGKVESMVDNTPVRDIIVEVRDTKLLETSFTNDDGVYSAGIYDFPGDRTFCVRFSDTDGALNGEYESFDTTIVFKDPIFINDDGSDWAGYADQFVNVKLKPKK